MTLKSSSSNSGNNNGGLLWQMTVKTLRRYIWLPILALLGFVLALPVVSALYCHHYAGYDWENYWNSRGTSPEAIAEWRTSLFSDLQTIWQGCAIAVIIAGGLLVALVLFRYLQVRTQVDFYHSLPVRREQYFWSNVLAAFLMFAAPYLVASLVNIAVVAVGGWLPFMDMGRYFSFMLFDALAYLTILSCGVLAMQLAGSMPGALKILVMAFGLCPLIMGTYTMLGSVFFTNYVELFSTLDNLLLRASAPVFVVWVSLMPSITGADWATAAILPAVLLGLSLVLYKRRSSEAAGSTLAFGWQRIPFKYPLVLIGGLMMGLAFYGISEGSGFWLYFGAAFGSIFMTALMDIFIKSDFKAIKKCWASAILSTVIVFVILAGYQGDWLGYNDYVPEADRVASAYVDAEVLHGFGIRSGYYYYGDGYLHYWDFSREDYINDNRMLQLTEADTVAALCELVDNGLEELNRYDYDIWHSGGYWGGYRWYKVVWELESGKRVARNYLLPDVTDLDLVERIMDGVDYTKNFVPEGYDIAKADVNGTVDVFLWNGYGDDNLEIKFASDEAEQRFFETVQREYGELSGEQLLYALPVCELEVIFYKDRTVDEFGYYDYTDRCWQYIRLHPDMTESLALLDQACGGKLLRSDEIGNIEQVRVLSRHDMTAAEAAAAAGQPEAAEYYEKYDGMTVETQQYTNYYWDYQETAVYTPDKDADKIREILQSCVRGNATYSSGIWEREFYDTYYEVTYKTVEHYGEDGVEPVVTIQSREYYPMPTKDMLENYMARRSAEKAEVF